MIKLKSLIVEQTPEQEFNGLLDEYTIKTKEGNLQPQPLRYILDAFKIKKSFPFIGSEGHLTKAGVNAIKIRWLQDSGDKRALDYTGNSYNDLLLIFGEDIKDFAEYNIVSIIKTSVIEKNNLTLDTYNTSRETNNKMEEKWTDADKISYNHNVWDKMQDYSLKLETFWNDVGKSNSEATNYFKRKGVQGPWYGNDNEEMARDLWWDYSTVGIVLYKKLKRVKLIESKLLKKLGELAPESQVQKIMNAMRNDSNYGSDGADGEDSIYEEITEYFNNDVEWDIQHPIINTADGYFRYSVAPEIDV
tara:strand:+ start:43 stop:954 length:912 start_codon:yes stop_codon:yes gene_type:complete